MKTEFLVIILFLIAIVFLTAEIFIVNKFKIDIPDYFIIAWGLIGCVIIATLFALT